MRNYPLFIIIVLFLYFFILPTDSQANEQKYKDDNHPISFEIEILPWIEAKEILPKGKKFTVIDVESGKQFNVQRRAGSRHADVQPLNTKDTKIMKEIYDGKWSWKRRAIIVKVGDQFIAASMHGMPHGGGALQNGFPGHFCIHFLGSTTHRTGKMDKVHKLMILKAGGKEEEYLHTVTPYELIEFFATAINYRDEQLLKLVSEPTKKQNELHKRVSQFSYFRINRISYLPDEDLTGKLIVEVPVEVKFRTEKDGRVTKRMTFILRKIGPIDRWKIDTDHFMKEIDGTFENLNE